MCEKLNCMYHAVNNAWGCDFSDLNPDGRCKLSFYPNAPKDPLRDKPKVCPCYKPGKRIPKDAIITGNSSKPVVLRKFGPKVKYDWKIAVKLYDEGKTDREIAEALSTDCKARMLASKNGEPLTPEEEKNCTCCKYSVKNWRADHGYVSKHRKPSTEDVHGKLLAIYYGSCSDAEIAEKSGYSVNSILNWRQAHGLPARGSRAGANVVDWDAVLNLLKNGVSVHDTAITMHVSEIVIERWIEKRQQTIEQIKKRAESRGPNVETMEQ